MNYALIRVSNGSFKIEQESSDLSQIKGGYYGKCQTYNNDPSVHKATIMIVDENLDVVEGSKYKEHFIHEVSQGLGD